VTEQRTSLTPVEQIERTLLGGDRKYTRLQVAEVAGVPLDRARRLWMAMGFPEVDDDDVVFTDNDVDALRVLESLVGNGIIDQSNEAAVARALAQPLSRLAEWQAQEVLSQVRRAGGTPSMLADLTTGLLPVIENLQSYVWRRHLAAAAGRVITADPESDPELPIAVVGFADIVGYTSTTRHSRVDELADLLETFEEDATATIASLHGRVVKTVGDEVMFVADSANDAAEIALRLSDPSRGQQGLPTLRVGLAMGPVLGRYGDVYGEVVNVAARLTSLARPGTVLVDREFTDALRGDKRYELRSRRPTSVRGYHHLRSWSLRRND
jgi:adenylate cyclase